MITKSKTLDIQRQRTRITYEWEKVQCAIWQNKLHLPNKSTNR